MNDFLKNHVAALESLLNGLRGATVVDTAVVVEDDFGFPEAWPVLILKTPTGELLQVEVSSDEEGNGPGHLFVGAAQVVTR